jgi:hypothetical protein
LGTSGPFFGPAARFCPAPGGTEGAYRAKTNKFRSSSRTQHEWSKIGRCVYTYFEAERAIFGPAARFCPAPGSAQRGPWTRKSREKSKIQIVLAHAVEIEEIREMHVHAF